MTHAIPFRSTLVSAVAFHARSNPYSIAVACGEEHVTYKRFAEDIERFSRRLASMKLETARRAVVNVAHPYAHWLLTLALSNLGVATVSMQGKDLRAFRFARADAVITDTDLPATDEALRIVRMDATWSKEPVDAFTAFAQRTIGADDPVRLILSSGTTGTPKKIMLSHGLLRERLRTNATGASYSVGSRVMTMMGADTLGGYMLPLTTWQHGGRVVLPMPNDAMPYVTLRREGVTVLVASPVQLSTMLQKMPRGAWPVEGLMVVVGGSALPRQLAHEIRLRLSQNLVVAYGSTEAGAVARVHASMEHGIVGGYVLPEAEVQIVDADHRPLPAGNVGDVRIRSLGTIQAYADEAPEGSDAFRDGWFYPGDAGTLAEDGMLAIVGRTKELMNFGGVKLAPTVVEDAVRECRGVSDLAAFAVQSASDVDQPWLAVVRGDAFEQQVLAARFKQRFPMLPQLRFAFVDAIPRNGMGKVLRNELRQLVQHRLSAAASGTVH